MAGSVAQVEGLLRRLGELEETVMLQQVSEDRLKEANIALMDRLSEFQRVNESNVTQAEDELARIHCALQEERAARAAAEQAMAEQQTYTVQQRGAVASASETAQSEGARAAALAEQLRLMMIERAFTARTAALGARALTRKYLLLLHERACRQRRLRGLQGSVLAGELLRSVRRAYLRAALGNWARLRSAEQLARRVLRAATIACARRCLAHWARWRQVGRMARRAQHVRLQRLQRHWLRALVSTAESARRLAVGLERVSSSARTRTRARLLRAWRRAVHAMREREEHAARHGARLEPRLCLLAGLRRWRRWIAGLRGERVVDLRREAAARLHWLEAAVERWRRAARYLAAMGLGGVNGGVNGYLATRGLGGGGFGQRRARRAGRSELWKSAGKASSAVPAAIHTDGGAIHSGAGAGSGHAATRRVALLQALQGNSLFLRARGCLMRWRAATRARRVLAKWLTEASLHALALGAAAALYWWRRLTRRHRGARRRRQRAVRYCERRLEHRVWRGWLRLVQLGRRRRDDEARKSWEAAHAGFVKWASVLETARAAVKHRRAAMAYVRRCRLARGTAAFRSCAAARVASQLARAAATARHRMASRRLCAAGLARWALACASLMRRSRQAVASELELRSELLAQSRAAAGAVESENDEFRARVESLETDIAVLQQVCDDGHAPGHCGHFDGHLMTS